MAGIGLISDIGLFQAARADVPLRPASVLVLERGRNPSTDYYVRPHAEGLGVPVSFVDSSRSPAAADGADALAPGSLVVIVRYLDGAWAGRIEAALPRLAGVAYFMDDDLLDLDALARVPLPHALRMAWLGWRHRAWLRRIGARLWVSTPWLAEKYRDWQPVLITPRPEPARQEMHPVRVFYHGTGLHRRELRWLAPIVAAVQARSQETAFEVFGRAAVARRYRRIPRVAVLHPMPWESYRAYCAAGRFHVGLAPLLPHAFNAARSHTRYFDFVRCGAAGIYSRVEPYASFVRHEVDGLLVDNEPAAWTEAILRLVEDAALRERLAAAAAERALG